MIVKCRECGKDISDEAKACPFCGCPKENINKQKVLLKDIKRLDAKRGFFIGGAIISFVVAFFFFLGIGVNSPGFILGFVLAMAIFILLVIFSVRYGKKIKQLIETSDYVQNELQASKGKRGGIGIFFAILLIIIGCLLAYGSGYNIGYY